MKEKTFTFAENFCKDADDKNIESKRSLSLCSKYRGAAKSICN